MDVEIVSSVRYGNYKNFLERAEFFKTITKLSEPRIRRFINLPEHIKIIMRPVRGVFGTAAMFKTGTKTRYVVEVDVRQTIDEFCDTLLHELVHIEQYFEERLKIKSERFFSIYEGQKVRLVSNKSAEYNQLPWEQEAIKRAARLVNIVYK
jgi:hypothetical protein